MEKLLNELNLEMLKNDVILADGLLNIGNRVKICNKNVKKLYKISAIYGFSLTIFGVILLKNELKMTKLEQKIEKMEISKTGQNKNFEENFEKSDEEILKDFE